MINPEERPAQGRDRRKLTIAVALAGGMVLAAASCSSAARGRLSKFFFEIPDESAQVEAPGDAGAAPPSGAVEVEASPPSARRFASVHRPFGEQRCTACHDGTSRMRVRADYLDACAECHVAYFAKGITHPPVGKGKCEECHVAHRSAEVALLTAPVFDACMECHDEPAKLSPRHHGRTDLEVERCTVCHDPHFGEGKRLRAGWPDGG